MNKDFLFIGFPKMRGYILYIPSFLNFFSYLNEKTITYE